MNLWEKMRKNKEGIKVFSPAGARKLRGLLRCAAPKNSRRPALTGLNVGKDVIVTTDGFVLVMTNDTLEDQFSANVPVTVSGHPPVKTGGAIYAEPIDGAPDIRQIMDMFKECADADNRIIVNIDLLLRALHALKDLGSENVLLILNNEKKPLALLGNTDKTNNAAMVMPLYVGESEKITYDQVLSWARGDYYDDKNA